MMVTLKGKSMLDNATLKMKSETVLKGNENLK